MRPVVQGAWGGESPGCLCCSHAETLLHALVLPQHHHKVGCFLRTATRKEQGRGGSSAAVPSGCVTCVPRARSPVPWPGPCMDGGWQCGKGLHNELSCSQGATMRCQVCEVRGATAAATGSRILTSAPARLAVVSAAHRLTRCRALAKTRGFGEGRIRDWV